MQEKNFAIVETDFFILQKSIQLLRENIEDQEATATIAELMSLQADKMQQDHFS